MVGDDGVLALFSADGDPLPSSIERKAKEQRSAELRDLLCQHCAEINAEIEAVVDVHRDTPAPDTVFPFHPASFEIERPRQPTKHRVNPVLRALLPFVVKGRVAANAELEAEYGRAVSEWERQRHRFDRDQQARLAEMDRMRREHVETMGIVLEAQFRRIQWPKETSISFDVLDGGRRVALDVDLPEIEDMPAQRARVAERGWKVSTRDLSARDLRQTYAVHIHGVIFRLIGEVYGVLPTVVEVTASGYSQRPDRVTGRVRDDYLLSARTTREQWSRFDFKALDRLDVVEALATIDIRRSMTKTYVFKPVEPF